MALKALIVAAAVACVAAPALAGTRRGAPAISEPGLAGRTDILFFADFEQENWRSQFPYRGSKESLAALPEAGFRGRGARMRTDSKSHYVDLRFPFARNGFDEPEELYLRYMMRYDRSVLAMPGGKWLGFGGTYGRAGWGGRRVNGTNGWSARGCFHIHGDKVKIGYYCYHADMKGSYGNTWNWDQLLEAGKWYSVECYVKLNTPAPGGGQGARDGVLRGWIDGRQVFERTGIRFRDSGELKIECAWLNFGTGKSPPGGIFLDIDNVVIARSYLGPPSPAAPKPEKVAAVAEAVAPAKARANAANGKAARLYRSARDAERRGMRDLARTLYGRLVTEFPDSPLAAKAKARLGDGS